MKNLNYIQIGIIVSLIIVILFMRRTNNTLENQIEENKRIQQELVLQYLKSKQGTQLFLDSLNVELKELQLSRDSIHVEYNKYKEQAQRYKGKKYNYDTMSALEVLHELEKRMYKR